MSDGQAMKDAHALRASDRPSRARRTVSTRGEVSESLKTILGTPGAAQKQRKYKNKPVTLDGITFDSQKEAARYEVLKLLVQAGEICCLEVHPRFQLVVHGVDLGYYEPDFRYFEPGHHAGIVEDVKSPATEKLSTFRLKAGLMWAIYGLKVKVV